VKKQGVREGENGSREEKSANPREAGVEGKKYSPINAYLVGHPGEREINLSKGKEDEGEEVWSQH